MARKRSDKEAVMNALECRSKYDPDERIHDPDYEPFCGECPYYYDYGGCDLTQILRDGSDVIQELLSSKHCYTCKHRKDPDSCDHWLPCQVMNTDDMWYCADWRDTRD